MALVLSNYICVYTYSGNYFVQMKFQKKAITSDMIYLRYILEEFKKGFLRLYSCNMFRYHYAHIKDFRTDYKFSDNMLSHTGESFKKAFLQ